MTPLLLLPLDDRPVNLALPVQLAAVAGETLVTPPRALLGRFLDPGDPDALLAWLAATPARTAILSLDMLAYGGLVASRTPTVSAEAALARLEALRTVKRARPDLTLYAFNVIMRLTITGSDPALRAAGRDIFRYSVLRDQVERLGARERATELADVTARIPAPLLHAYLAARARNHAVNRAALALLADGVLDFLALVQEDTAPAGLHVAEQHALQAEARGSRWRLYAGTDEAAQTLLARAVLEERGAAFPVDARFRGPADTPALYEDTPLAETVRRHIDAVGGTPAPGAVLAVHTFTPPQADLFDAPPLAAPTWDAALAAYPDTGAAAWLDTLPAPVAVADVAYCNGGDPHLLAALLARGRFAACLSYAGWNTAGNTLGTALAHAALRLVGGDSPAHRDALFVRLLDDGLYQPIVRGWLAARVEESGASALNVGEALAAHADAWVDDALHALWRDLCARYPAAAALDRPFRATLPWGRVFEVAIELL